MPTPEAAHTAITAWFDPAFKAKMTARSLTVPVIYPGDKRSAPPAVTQPFATFAWKRVISRVTDIGTQQSVSAPTAIEIEFREEAHLSVYVPDGAGDLLLDRITMDAMVLFATIAWSPDTVAGVRFVPDMRPESTPRATSPVPDTTFGARLKSTVIAPYMFEFTAS